MKHRNWSRPLTKLASFLGHPSPTDGRTTPCWSATSGRRKSAVGVHLQSGLPYEYHTYSYPYACLSMTFDRPSIADPEKTQWEALTREKFDGKRLCFGQLVCYRKKLPRRGPWSPIWLLACFLVGESILVFDIDMLFEF